MTREFKFRAWNTRRKTMEYVNDLYWFEESLVHQNGDNNFVLMQWTGWKDDNQPRKEIYEGDFLQDKREQNWLVIWSDTEAAWMLVRRSYWHRFSDVIMSGPWRISGNQFENPELL